MGSEPPVAHLLEEQTALRRVATLVAEGVSARELFERGRTRGGNAAEGRHRQQCSATSRARPTPSSRDGWPAAIKRGSARRWTFESDGDLATIMSSMAYGAVRIDDYEGRPGRIASFLRDELGVRSSVGCPIVVDAKVWGALLVHSRQPGPLPADTESRLGNFTELVATAIANTKRPIRGRAPRRGTGGAPTRRHARGSRSLCRGDLHRDRRGAGSAHQRRRHQHASHRRRRHGRGRGTLGAIRHDHAGRLPRATGRRERGLAGAPHRTAGADRRLLESERCHRRACSRARCEVRGRHADRDRRTPVGCDGGRLPTARGAPAETEARIAEFTELMAIAIANIQARSEVATSGRASSTRPTRSAGGSSATCTTARSSASSTPS